MKKLAILMLLYIFIVTTILGFENSFANEYEVLDDTIFTYPHQVCIDPGHGGPTACKYDTGSSTCNGDGAGSYGYEDSLSEQWINIKMVLGLQ